MSTFCADSIKRKWIPGKIKNELTNTFPTANISVLMYDGLAQNFDKKRKDELKNMFAYFSHDEGVKNVIKNREIE